MPGILGTIAASRRRTPSITGTAYHVDPVAGDDGNSGLSPATAWASLAQANTASLSPGDGVLLRRGMHHRGGITIAGSGISGSPVVYGAYGTAGSGTYADHSVINGATHVTGWTSVGSSRYTRTFGSKPQWLFSAEDRLAEVGVVGSVAAGTWHWDGSTTATVHLPGGADPDSGDGVTSGQEWVDSVDYSSARCFDFNGNQFVYVAGIAAVKAPANGFYAENGAADLTLVDTRGDLAGGNGYRFYHAAPDESRAVDSLPRITVRRGTAYRCLLQGLSAINRVDDLLVEDFDAVENSLSDTDGTGATTNFTAGARVVANFAGVAADNVTWNRPDRVVFRRVRAIRNGAVAGWPVTSERGYGIWFDTTGVDCLMEDCEAYDNRKGGLYWEWGGDLGGGQIVRGVAAGNQIGIHVSRYVNDLLVAHCTCYGNVTGIANNSNIAPFGNTNVTVLNTISAGNSVRQLNTDEFGSDPSNRYDRVAFGPASTAFVRWNNVGQDTYNALESAMGVTLTRVEGDPLLVDPPDDLTLQAASGCVDFGEVIVGVNDNYLGAAPDLGAYEYAGT